MTTTLQPQLHHHPPPPPPQFQRVSTCDRHPDVPVTGFCASCLRERLAGLETASRNRTGNNTSRGPSSALKSIFFRQTNQNPPPSNTAASSSSSFRPELRRCKSFSGGRGDGTYGPLPTSTFEPQRRSCDVRGRSTLWSLFHLDDNHRQDVSFPPASSSSSSAAAAAVFPAACNNAGIEMECRNLVFPSVVPAPVLESREEEEEEEEESLDVVNADEEEEEEEAAEAEKVDEGDEIRPVADEEIVAVEETVKTREEEGEEEEVRPIKDYTELDATQPKKPPPKDLKDIAGSFWLAASVFSKKLQKWRRKQKLKKQSAAGTTKSTNPAALRTEKTQSEIAIDVFGRRSCDIDPRFSLDAGRFSFDDPRYSLDEPRASWDGYLTGGRSVFSRFPPPSMLAVVEDTPAPAVLRSDGLIPVEEDPIPPLTPFPCGGTAQTRDYYTDPLQRRRKSLDRSSSMKRPAAVEHEEPKIACNAKVVSASIGNEFFRDSNSNSMRDDRCDSFGSAYRDLPKVGGLPRPTKKSRRWSKAWNIWGFIQRRGNGGGGNGGNGVERTQSESWPELRREVYNRSLSSRYPYNSNGGFGSMRRTGLEVNGHVKKRREEIVLERNRSGRYPSSPGHIDNGMLRFYLTPMRGSRRAGGGGGGGGSGKGRHKSSNSFSRSVLRLY